MNRQAIAALAFNTRDAYSFHYYGVGAWTRCCSLLVKHGFTIGQAETILRSTFMRFAADGRKNRKATSEDMMRLFLSDGATSYIKELFAETPRALRLVSRS